LAPGFYQRRPVRTKLGSCRPQPTPFAIGSSYLSSFESNLDQILQGGVEQSLSISNGVLDANRGQSDIMAILIRRGREMGVPSFTDIRRTVAVTTPCTPASWTDVSCKPTDLWSAATVAKLKNLYGKPQDVDLIVGSMLSVEQFTANNLPLDKTQAFLMLGEIERIIQKDAFGIRQLCENSFIVRAKNDDPGVDQLFPLIDAITEMISIRSVANLIRDNADVNCMPGGAFSRGGNHTLLSPVRNLYQFQEAGVIVENCDADLSFFDNFQEITAGSLGPPGLSYSCTFCFACELTTYECMGYTGVPANDLLPFCV